jgi:CubicO group peptidase (beta-lactamase class C family)
MIGPSILFSILTLPLLAQEPSEADIRKMLVDRIDSGKQSVGIVVGIVSPKGRRIVAYGNPAKDDKRPLNGDTVFEIGSMTKVFTSLVLMDMVERGEVSLDDPVAKYRSRTVSTCAQLRPDDQPLR